MQSKARPVVSQRPQPGGPHPQGIRRSGAGAGAVDLSLVIARSSCDEAIQPSSIPADVPIALQASQNWDS